MATQEESMIVEKVNVYPDKGIIDEDGQVYRRTLA